MVFGCFYRNFFLYTITLPATGISKQITLTAEDELEPPPPPPPGPPPPDGPFPPLPAIGMLRRENEAHGPFEKEWGKQEQSDSLSETKANIVKAFDYIDNRIRNKIEARTTPMPARTSNAKEHKEGDSTHDLEAAPTPLPAFWTLHMNKNDLSTGQPSSGLQVAQYPPPGMPPPGYLPPHMNPPPYPPPPMPPPTTPSPTQPPPNPPWYHNGRMPDPKTDLKFEYQSAIGRDGYEPDPLRPASEFFGPFRLDYKHHTLYLENWNLAIQSMLDRGGMGNLVVGLHHSYDKARNSVILGDSNEAIGSYGLVAGRHNKINGRGAVISGGAHNLASGVFSSVGGGTENNATAVFASVRGGKFNLASGPFSVVTGGTHNIAAGAESVVNAGFNNVVLGNMSAINGGVNNSIPVWNVSAVIEGGALVGADVVTGPPEIFVPTAENTDNPDALAACDSPECGEEESRIEEKTAAARVHKAGHDHYQGGGVPEIRRRRSAPVLPRHGVPLGDEFGDD
eukprot:gnl/MRDRNA2_/MRDRNA2_62441_c0_seq2.p1 gnl/MRDRNA2_/MRDRNA2_62441_c0~~gnl/MRDRNA2_/MRDRNA2_62441_c0_seq2.p1  ORF type:complete len:509 (+),score=94.89 gnl/MRDRNA2_/MRDRNA2_62441_c0_seq2:98-1624(+)